MLELGLKTLIGYLLGSLMGALLVGAIRGVDIRELGSGNAGGTNALRTQGIWFAAGTVLIDVGKGWLAAGWLPQLEIPGVAMDPLIGRDWLAVCCAAAAVAGHVWPQFHGFRGGKGGATLAGALLALAPVLAAIAIGAWLLTMMLTGFAGLATITAAISIPAAMRLLGLESAALLAFSLVMASLVVFAHRSNITRMWQRTEPRVDRLWLLRPRTPQR
ncbi:MAG: glycerol-3-phosphate 1-O-acyltransferase PlsY [Steroidobacteraceae bacterium]